MRTARWVPSPSQQTRLRPALSRTTRCEGGSGGATGLAAAAGSGALGILVPLALDYAEATGDGLAMLKIRVNGAETNLIAKLRLDGAWDLRCLDPLVGEFRLHSGDVLYLWSEEFEEWLPASEDDLVEPAVWEEEKRIKNMSYGVPCCFLHDSGRHCGKQPANFGTSWLDDDSGSEDAIWYCLLHFKEMQAAPNMRLLLSAHIAAMPFDECG